MDGPYSISTAWDLAELRFDTDLDDEFHNVNV